MASGMFVIALFMSFVKSFNYSAFYVVLSGMLYLLIIVDMVRMRMTIPSIGIVFIFHLLATLSLSLFIHLIYSYFMP